MSKASPWYQRKHSFAPYTRAEGEAVAAEFDAIQASFEKIPAMRDDGKGFIVSPIIPAPTDPDHPVPLKLLSEAEQSVYQSLKQVEASAQQAAAQASQSTTSASQAQSSAAAANGSAISAANSERNADQSENLARRWASEEVDREVENGKYSAMHYAHKAALAHSEAEIVRQQAIQNMQEIANSAQATMEQAVDTKSQIENLKIQTEGLKNQAESAQLAAVQSATTAQQAAEQASQVINDGIWVELNRRLDEIDNKKVNSLIRHVIDLSQFDPNKWHIVLAGMPQPNKLYHFELWQQLYQNPSGKPVWANHEGGFCLQCIWDVTPSRWGTWNTTGYRQVHCFQYLHCEQSPILGLDHIYQSSQDVFSLRGGTTYFLYTEQDVTIEIVSGDYLGRSGVYTWSVPQLTNYDASLIPKPTRVLFDEIGEKFSHIETQLSNAQSLAVEADRKANQVQLAQDRSANIILANDTFNYKTLTVEQGNSKQIIKTYVLTNVNPTLRVNMSFSYSFSVAFPRACTGVWVTPFLVRKDGKAMPSSLLGEGSYCFATATKSDYKVFYCLKGVDTEIFNVHFNVLAIGY